MAAVSSPSGIKPFFLVEWIRVGFLAVLMGAVILSQSLQPFFYNPGYEVPILTLIGFHFFSNVVLVLNIEKVSEKKVFALPFFVLDVFLIALMVYYSGTNLPVYVLMFLLNILLSGLVFGRQVAIYLATLTAVCFNITLAVGTRIEGPALMFSLLFNNLSFFVVAYLAGYFSEQLNFMGERLAAKERDVAALKDFNDVIMKNMPSAILLVDGRGEILFANPTADRILGYKTTGRAFSEAFPTTEIGELMSGERTDLKYIAASGEELVLSTVGQGFYDPTQELRGHLLMFEDLTQVKRIEEKMRQSEKLAAVGQLAAGIAHEIRNPLASISGSVELIQSMGVEESQERLMKIVVKETHRLSDLITEFLEYVRPDKPVKDEIHLSSLAQEVAEIIKLNPNLSKEVSLELDIEEKVFILGDRNKLKQAILNIVINAYQAMDDVEEAKCFLSVKSGPTRMIIRDTGCGMDEKTRSRIFEPFLTTKAKGTGLGLAVTHKILENHGVDIDVSSTLGEGTEFLLNFPSMNVKP